MEDFTPEEVTEYLIGYKGAYNAGDLNRIGAALEMIRGILQNEKYQLDVSPKTDWKNSDFPDYEKTQVIINDIKNIRNSIPFFPNTPLSPESMNNLDHKKANDIEKILYDFNILINNMIISFVQSGELYAGETSN